MPMTSPNAHLYFLSKETTIRVLIIHKQNTFVIIHLPVDICAYPLLHTSTKKKSSPNQWSNTGFVHPLSCSTHIFQSTFPEQWMHHWTERLFHRRKQRWTWCSFFWREPQHQPHQAKWTDRDKVCHFLWKWQIDLKCYTQHQLPALQSFHSASYFTSLYQMGSISLGEPTVNFIAKQHV